jgi:methylthioribulose-1-phosphate dehydratase
MPSLHRPVISPSFRNQSFSKQSAGVHKERVQSGDIFVLDIPSNTLVHRPPNPTLTLSACTPLFLTTFRLRNAGACIHTHSVNTVMVSMMSGKEVVITHQEMLKGVKNGVSGKACGYHDTIRIPIIENTAFEQDLEASLAEVTLFQTLNINILYLHRLSKRIQKRMQLS